MHRKSFLQTLLLVFVLSVFAQGAKAEELRLAAFDVDATPAVGSELAYQTMTSDSPLSLRARGIVLLGAGKPIVLCAIDWIGIGNEGQDAFKAAMAEAAGTSPDRVEVHTVHQHDAPICDFTAERILREKGINLYGFDGTFARKVIQDLQQSICLALPNARKVTDIGLGKADVRKVASNRLIQMKDGTWATRYSSEPKRKEFRKAPEGLVDREVSLLSFWDGDQPLAVLSFYATHPQSYYLTGVANPDFPGVARFFRDLEVPDVLHVHFNGAGGNIAAGKYNNGSHRNRLILAQRLAKGMAKAWKDSQKYSVTSEDIRWKTIPMLLPYQEDVMKMGDKLDLMSRNVLANSVGRLGWVQRRKDGRTVQAACLSVGERASILFMPGELFVEYQLAAKRMAPDKFVAMAAYGDYGPFYIGTKKAYRIGGYETESSPVTPEVEDYIHHILEELLK